MSQVVDFTARKSSLDVVLVIEGKKLYVNRNDLINESDYFRIMLTGEYEEHKRDEIMLKETNYEEFLVLLKVLYPPHEKIKDVETCEFLLELGRFYQMKCVLNRCDLFLCEIITGKDDVITLEKKLLLTSEYKLSESKKACLNLDELKTLSGVYHLISKKYYRKLSDDFQVALLENAVKLAFSSVCSHNCSSGECDKHLHVWWNRV